MSINDKMNIDFKKRTLLKKSLLGLVGVGAVSVFPLARKSAGVSKDSSTNWTSRDTSSTINTEYDFIIAGQRLAPDGVSIDGITINQQYPGPEIRVKEGDILRITCANKYTEPTTLHWHGIILPNPMDGVPEVTQRPIMQDEVFVYEYQLRQTGTYWYHSHYKLQEQIGLAGPLIIEPKKEYLTYDKEYTLMFTDWLHQSPYQILKRLKQPDGMQEAASAPDLADIDYPSFLLNGKDSKEPWYCHAKPGDKLRFRIINAGASSYFWFSIDDHELEVVEVDGQPIEPVIVENILMATAERYDVIVRVKKAGQFAIRGIVQTKTGQAMGLLQVGSHRKAAENQNKIPSLSKSSLVDKRVIRSLMPVSIPEGPKRHYELVLGGDMKNYTWSINGEIYPKASPLICSPGEQVYVDVINKTNMYHPMHLHGHFMRPIINGEIVNSPLVDIISVPPKSKRRFMFVADNPGRWFFHCHNLYHLATGMAREFHYKI